MILSTLMLTGACSGYADVDDDLDPLDGEATTSESGDQGPDNGAPLGARDETQAGQTRPTASSADDGLTVSLETEPASEAPRQEALAFHRDDAGNDPEGPEKERSESEADNASEAIEGAMKGVSEPGSDSNPENEALNDGSDNAGTNDDATERDSESESNHFERSDGLEAAGGTNDDSRELSAPNEHQQIERVPAPISGYPQNPYQCIWTEVQDAVECGVATVADAAVCGYTLTRDATRCGTEIVRDAAACGTTVVSDATRCGTKTVTDVARCGTRTVTSAATCGVDVIASGLECVARLAQGKSCESPKTCQVAATCEVAKQCEVAAECSVPSECNIAATCEIAKTCDVQICKQTAPGGQCTPILAECDLEGFSCQVSADAEVFRCLPNYEKDLSVEDEAVCRALYVEAMSDMAREAGNTLAFSAGSSASIGARGSIEVGTVYGEGGQYGCFVATCEGFESDIQISDFANLGAYVNWDAFAGESQTFSFGASIPEIEIGVSTTSVLDAKFETYIGQVDSVSLGLGLAPAQASYAACTTTVFQVENP